MGAYQFWELRYLSRGTIEKALGPLLIVIKAVNPNRGWAIEELQTAHPRNFRRPGDAALVTSSRKFRMDLAEPSIIDISTGEMDKTSIGRCTQPLRSSEMGIPNAP